MAAHRGHWTAGLRGTGFDVTGVRARGHRRKGLDCTGYITRHSRLSPMRFNARSRTSAAIPAKVLSVLSLRPSAQRVSIPLWRFVLRHRCRSLIRLLFLDPFISPRFLAIPDYAFRTCYFALYFRPFMHVMYECRVDITVFEKRPWDSPLGDSITPWFMVSNVFSFPTFSTGYATSTFYCHIFLMRI